MASAATNSAHSLRGGEPTALPSPTDIADGTFRKDATSGAIATGRCGALSAGARIRPAS